MSARFLILGQSPVLTTPLLRAADRGLPHKFCSKSRIFRVFGVELKESWANISTIAQRFCVHFLALWATSLGLLALDYQMPPDGFLGGSGMWW